MKNTRTTWTAPKTNIIAAANDLRKCLAGGYKARLIRIANEDCEHPILLDKEKESHDFREYDFAIGTLRTKAEIKADTSMTEFEKYLSLNYHTCYGTEDAAKRYYETGVLSRGNFFGMGKSHLVKVSDMVKYLQRGNEPNDKEWAKNWEHYSDEEDVRHFYDTFRLKSAQYRTPKVFSHKLWVVEIIGKDTPIRENPLIIRILMGLITIAIIPLKFIPESRVMDMDGYKWINLRVGSVMNGYSIDIHIPRKFSFKDKI